MTDPVVIRRALTVHFARSVTFPDQIPVTMEVIVVPLADPSSAVATATFVSPSATQTVLLNAADNIVTFNLVPTDLPGLTERVLYRIMWRAGVTGKTEKFDFAMPDQDINFDALGDLGEIITGETYLQQADLGVPGRVARLNNAGEVVDAFGTPVATQTVLQTLQGDISVERVARQTGDASVRNDLSASIETQFNQAIITGETNLAAAQETLNEQIASEAAIRAANDSSEAVVRAGAASSLTTALTSKADLVSGKVPMGQIPDSVKIQGVSVADEAAMLALTTSQVQQFDYAIRPTGLWLFKGTDPSNLSHWAKINRVTSVNTQEGDVVLTAADVGAIPIGGSIAQSQVTGLVSALTGKAATTVTDGLNTRLAVIEGDTTIVHTSGGFINHDLNDNRMAYVDATGEFVTTKDGTILSGAGGTVASVNGHVGTVVLNAADVGAIATGGAIAESQVTGLVADLAAKVGTSDSRLTNARTPTAHAPSHAVAGSDPITIAQSQVTGLATTLTNHGNRLTSLETRVTTLEGGGGGGGGAAVGSTVFWEGVAETEDFTEVTLHSPFGVDTDGSVTGTIGHKYHTPAGAVATDVRYPYITPNGHLELREWKESNPADPAMATQAALDTTNTVVATKANQSSLDTTNTTVATKASTAALNTLSDIVATKAAQTSLDNTNAIVANKANQVDLDTTNTNLTAKANQSSLNTTNTNVTALQAGKADLVGGHVPLAQVPSLPTSQVSGLVGALAAKADLSGGFLVLAQVPSGIPTSKVSGLDASLALKADLVGGTVPTNQMPALTLMTVTVVANRAAMLAQSTSTVQPGDVTVITATSDQGSYILQATDPSVFENWVLLQTPLAPVLTVNGQMGTVVLGASDVGALAANASVPISQVTGLQSTLDSKATGTALTDGLATKTSVTDVRTILSASVEAKQKINYVATGAVPSLSGQQSVDGTLMPLGSVVLLTAQSSSVLNGIWQVNSGAWTRVADMASGSYLVKGTVVVVGFGAVNANTVWQVTSASGVVDTNLNNWAKIGNVAPPYAPIQGNGIAITGIAPTQTITAVAASGGGAQVSSGGIGVDFGIVTRKALGTVPAGSTTTTLTHNLNTTSPMVQIIEASSGAGVLIGWAVTGANTVSVEFSSAPSTGQWRYAIFG